MEKRIVLYCIIDPKRTEWPRAVLAKFSEERNSHGNFVFEEGSVREQEFHDLTRRVRFRVERTVFIQCTGRDLDRYPFYYLHVQEDRPYLKNDYMDESLICGDNETLLCQTGVNQRYKIVLDSRKSKKLDIMYDLLWQKPKIFIISRRLKELLVQLGATGCVFVPCLVKGQNYSEEDLLLNSSIHELSHEVDYFQLIVRSRVIGPLQVGEVVKVYIRCPKCDAVHGYRSTESFFLPDDLSPVDFQTCDTCLSDNIGEFVSTGEAVIISKRILRLFLDNKIRGLSKFLVDPPIKYGVVEIKTRSMGADSAEGSST